MCGIVGMIGNTPVASHIFKSIENLLNRGYDSVGVYLGNDIVKYISDNQGQAFEKLKESSIKTDELMGIGHTRWATHGSINVSNAHPHISNNKEIILVHNGIINNYSELKEMLSKNNYLFYSETDTEVIVNLIEYCLLKENNLNINNAINEAMKMLDGTYGICLYYKKTPSRLYCFKNGSPLVVAKTDKHLIVTSEISGLNNATKTYIMLNNKDLCVLERNADRNLIIHSSTSYICKTIQNEKYLNKTEEHWTLSEINDQTNSLMRVINNGGRIQSDTNVNLGGLKHIMKNYNLRNYKHLLLIGCGTSYFAAKVGVHYFKRLTDFENIVALDGCELTKEEIPTSSVAILLSQSGETRDLIVCMDYLREKYCLTLGCINKVDSYLAVKTDGGIYLNAGIERGVASTKSFTSQLIGLKLIALQLSEITINKNILGERRSNISDIVAVSNKISDVLNNQKIIEFADKIKKQNSMFLLGKGLFLPIAEEGALKIKELSYIHAEAYSGSALKHGPFSLLQEEFPVILIIHKDQHYNKMKIAFDEIKTRKANILVLTNDKNFNHSQKIVISCESNLSEIYYIILLQQLAYYLSIKRGINPDFPRNLAKVVTVD